MFKKFRWSLLPVIIALAWPTMLEQLLHTAVQYIDTAMVGSLGTDATAAVGAPPTATWLIGGSVSALAVGFLAVISQSLGADNREHALRVSAQSVLVTLAVGIFFTAATLILSPFIPAMMQVDEAIRDIAAKYFFVLYTPMLFRSASIIFGAILRAAGDSKTPMVVGIIVNAVNVVLNLAFIYPTREITLGGISLTVYGADMGVIGAAVASAAAYTLGGIIITVALFRHKVISPGKMQMRLDKEVLSPCLKIALPNMLQRFGTSLGYVFFASMINSLGEIATAAHTIANTVESAFYIPGYGMQAAAATLTGNAHGAGDRQKIKDLARLLVLCEVLLMIISGGLLFVFAPAMMTVFSKDPEVIKLGSTVLKMVALSEPVYGVSIIIEGMLQGQGNTKTPFKFNIIGMWGIRIVGTFICTSFLGLGLVSAWGCMIAHNVLLFVMFTIYYNKKLTDRKLSS